MLGVNTMPSKEGWEEMFVQEEYRRIFVDDNKTLTYMTGVFESPTTSERFTLSNDELNLVHMSSGQIYRHMMENVMKSPEYRKLQEAGTERRVSFTEDEIANTTREQRAEFQRQADTRAKLMREKAREFIWRPLHNTVKEITRAYYLGEISNLSAMKFAISEGALVTQTLWQLGPDNAISELEQWGKLLRDSVFERGRDGKYTKEALEAQEDLNNVKHWLNMGDLGGEYEQMAENVLRKYSRNSVDSRFLIHRQAIDGIIDDMHGYINTEEFESQAGQIIRNINENIKKRQEGEGELPWYQPDTSEFEGVSP
tara:strand:- start:51 stop:986 length:936 start_codon:yes stop_codon:yes gene_type:complete